MQRFGVLYHEKTHESISLFALKPLGAVHTKKI